MTQFSIPDEPRRRGIPLRTFPIELDKTYAKPINLIYVGTAGDLRVETPDGSIVTFTGVPQGKDIIGFFVKVYSSGTTAQNLVGQTL